MPAYEAPPGYKLVSVEPLDQHIGLKVTKSTHKQLRELADALVLSPGTAVRWLLEQDVVQGLIHDTVKLTEEARRVAGS